MFLRNHDELTLEMVTDEERDYMYRAYAADTQARINLGIRRRLAPLLRNDRRRIELMNALLFSMPGTPVVYYGDEIGMGDNIYLGDRNGVRTPMQWSSDRNAGFSRANPQKLYLPVIIDPEYHYETVNVEAQQSNPSSLLWWMKRLIALRKRYKAFGRGSISFLRPDNAKILSFVRRYEGETILVVANLSRFVQYVRLDLSEFAGMVPHELFGRTAFPPCGADPYLLTLGPHGFYWFSVMHAPARHTVVVSEQPRETPAPRVAVAESWEELLTAEHYDRLEWAIKAYLTETVVHHGKARTVRDVTVRAAAKVPIPSPTALALVDAEFLDGETQLRAVRLGYAPPERAEAVAPGAVVARLTKGGEPAGVLFDARTDHEYAAALLRGIAQTGAFPFDGGEVVAVSFPGFASALPDGEVPEPITLLRSRQHDLTVMYGTRAVLKTFERLEAGVNPALELGRFLTEHTAYHLSVPVIGAVELHPADAQPRTMAVLYQFVNNEGTAWQYTLDAISRFYEAVLAHPMHPPPPAPADAWLADVAPAAEGRELFDPYMHTAEQLGADTAAMHRALASAASPAIAPEPFGKLYQRSIYQGMRTRVGLVFRELARSLADLPEAARGLARTLLSFEGELTRRCRAVLRPEVTGQRIRVHGNYHLGELLYTGSGFVVIDFEGDPERPLSERRIKRSALRDVADMIRSFHYAALTPLAYPEDAPAKFSGVIRAEDRRELHGWAKYWASWVSARFVRGYLAEMAGTGILPPDPAVCRELLELFVQQKAVAELGAELEHRPGRAAIPMIGLLDLLGADAPAPYVAGGSA
jgi:maltose alpha-D-glucosyltransferase/alpha-amylase